MKIKKKLAISAQLRLMAVADLLGWDKFLNQ